MSRSMTFDDIELL